MYMITTIYNRTAMQTSLYY